MPPVKQGAGAWTRRQWRSLDELSGSPEFHRFVENEFPESADKMLEPASRRTFLKVMGASMALAGMTSCRWPQQEILPFTARPDGYVPGDRLDYATSFEIGGVALGLLVASVDGRPIKVDGNPTHPSSLGGTSAIAQGSLLELYDPDRSRSVLRLSHGERHEAGWADFEAFLAERMTGARANGGSGLRILSEGTSSPTVQRLRERVASTFPRARWHEYEPIGRDEEREGLRAVFGRPHRPQLALDRAEVVISLDEDFLLHHPAAVRYARDFIERRVPESGSMSRLYAVESTYTITGTMADHRYAIQARMIPVFAGCLGANLLLEHGLVLPPHLAELGRMLERFQAHPLYTEIPGFLGRDLVAAGSRGLLVAGARQPAPVHALVAALNQALGATGNTVSYAEEPEDRAPHVDSLVELTQAMAAGAVDTLVILGGNPVYDAPADLAFASALERVPAKIHLSQHVDETSLLCDWHLPRAHYLEAWGDARDWRGTLSLSQPLIDPLFGGRSPIEVLALLAGLASPDGHTLVRETFHERGFDRLADWRRALHDGWVAGTEWPQAAPPVTDGPWVALLAPFLRTHVGAPDRPSDLELVFLPDPGLWDGRFANNGWLQEAPDPLTKLTWDNAALVAPATAEALGLAQGTLARFVHDRREIELPIYVLPGQPPGSIGVHLGYGRTAVGQVGERVGFDVYPLRTTRRMHAVPVSVEPLGVPYLLATTQNHHALDPLGEREVDERSRVLAREMRLEDYLAQQGSEEIEPYEEHVPEIAEHAPAEAPLWKEWEYPEHRWAMAIDLNRCIGCNACVVACVAENNVPIVGKEEVARGREMLWLRIDRYFAGGTDDPGLVHQPVPCMHCEQAPCEQVCPVAATVHDNGGLNLMVYNRCVGTRYCANNCPYKVRRFNYFNNHREEGPLEAMVYNPEVTVRSRGVMEKCTYCVQRIQNAKIDARNEGRPIRDGEVTTACADACPTRAIVFGDLNDESSRVRRLHADRRTYSMLDWLGVKPRTRYMTKLRNPAPAAPEPEV